MQKKAVVPQPSTQKPVEFSPAEQEARSSGLLSKIEEAKQLDDPIVWTCLTRLQDGGCRRTFPEHDPPDCPIYTEDEPSHLFKGAVRCRLSYLKSRLNKDGTIKAGMENTFVSLDSSVEARSKGGIGFAGPP